MFLYIILKKNNLESTDIFEVKIPQLLKLINYVTFSHAVSYKKSNLESDSGFENGTQILDLVKEKTGL